ncbi:MAG: SUF system NifU family Fe-S cluster assembly protein [Propionibacteriaceae bacterium]|nr:SUF system NifU family Fe-S cluster assembly protein [Propionibacteriaceae bacterium]
MNLDELYSTIISDHNREKHHSGLRDPYEAEVHHVNPSCGDEITLRVHLDGDVIADMSYDGYGCAISQASASILGDLAVGHGIDNFSELYDGFLEMLHSKGTMELDEGRYEDAIAFVGVSKLPARVKCALLAWTALRDAVGQATSKEN